MPVNWEAVARSELHPLRVLILEAAEETEVSPATLSREWNEPLGNVAYHVRMLADKGLLRETRAEPRRGAIEHFYTIGVAAHTWERTREGR